jgi:hypothetical protein
MFFLDDRRIRSGDGDRSVSLTYGSVSRRPKNIWILRIRIRNLVLSHRIPISRNYLQNNKMSNIALEIRITVTGHILGLGQNFYRIEYSYTVPGDDALHEGSLLHQAGEVPAAPVHPAIKRHIS